MVSEDDCTFALPSFPAGPCGPCSPIQELKSKADIKMQVFIRFFIRYFFLKVQKKRTFINNNGN